MKHTVRVLSIRRKEGPKSEIYARVRTREYVHAVKEEKIREPLSFVRERARGRAIDRAGRARTMKTTRRRREAKPRRERKLRARSYESSRYQFFPIILRLHLFCDASREHVVIVVVVVGRQGRRRDNKKGAFVNATSAAGGGGGRGRGRGETTEA